MNYLVLGAALIGSLACVLEAPALPEAVAPEGQDRSVRVGDIDIGYRVYGKGSPLVMIMGYGSTMQLWEPAMLRELASRFQVIVFDNRGMGATGSGRKDFSIEQFADDTDGFMDAISLARADVLGWSMGGMIAQELALRHPEKVGRLVLYATHCDASMFPPSP
jgi:pimeloyl-ACP methyl ester carboxylesterase